MARTVECLGCGRPRLMPAPEHALDVDACPRCGYVGWAPSASLSEDDRRVLREIPLALRPLDNPLERLDWR